jgi:hypothetical protein
MLQRAIDALRSEHRALHTEALGELGYIQDARASYALIEAINRSAGSDAPYRFEATAALARQVETAASPDPVALAFLRTLTTDVDADVRSVALAALKGTEDASTNSVRH